MKQLYKLDILVPKVRYFSTITNFLKTTSQGAVCGIPPEAELPVDSARHEQLCIAAPAERAYREFVPLTILV